MKIDISAKHLEFLQALCEQGIYTAAAAAPQRCQGSHSPFLEEYLLSIS